VNTKKDFYNNILSISKEIELLIQLENFDKIEELLLQRDELLTKISKEDFEIEEIKEIIGEIKILDEKNFGEMDKFKQEISKKMLKLSKNKKMIGFYKQDEIYQSGFFDEKSD
jgi:hypothetical protein